MLKGISYKFLIAHDKKYLFHGFGMMDAPTASGEPLY